MMRRPRALVNHDGDRAAPRRSRVAGTQETRALRLRRVFAHVPTTSAGAQSRQPQRRPWTVRTATTRVVAAGGGGLILHNSTVEAIDLRERWAPWDSNPQPTD